ncbi:MAG TPA: hypothetical protein VMU07_03815 [Candidatus Paceibacterota bacterium]|nr:hypothetical protein [Candidatus Paceibacterota bacterium]
MKKYILIAAGVVILGIAAFVAVRHYARTAGVHPATLLASSSSIPNLVPLTDFAPGEKYLGAFDGFLYDGTNTMPAAHAADGMRFASEIQPLDVNGNPSPAGKIVVVGIGMSNWTIELCNMLPRTNQDCNPGSFIYQTEHDPTVNHTNLVIVDCAQGSQVAAKWLDDSKGNYAACVQILSSEGLSAKQVQVILFKDADPQPKYSLASSTQCTANSAIDACIYEREVGNIARFAKMQFPNVKQMFVHTRIYAGYATTNLNPEPFAYEYGFANKWLVAAQIDQIAGAPIDPVAGDLSYAVAPWIAWGPYFWADGNSPRSDGLAWIPSDYNTADYTHPNIANGVPKVASLMMQFYAASPFTPWFRASGHSTIKQ